jgi:Tfp pilus assembly protein PilF
LNFFAIKILPLCIGILFSACQTFDASEEVEIRRGLLKTHKQIVHATLDEGKPDVAHKELKKLLKQFPRDPDLLNLMGLTQINLKNYKRATVYFNRSLAIKPQIGTILNLSSAITESGNYIRAITILKKALKSEQFSLYPYPERLYHNLGYILVKSGRTGKAQNYYQRALEENPTFYPSYMELARIHQSKGLTSKASQAYRKAIDYCHKCFEPVEALVNMHLAASRPFAAHQLLLRYTKVDDLLPGDLAKARRLIRVVASLKDPTHDKTPRKF